MQFFLITLAILSLTMALVAMLFYEIARRQVLHVGGQWAAEAYEREPAVYAGRLVSVRLAILSVAVFLFLLAYGLILLFARRLVRQLSRIHSAMNEAGGGNLAQRVQFQFRDEFGMLEDSFNDLVRKLRRIPGGSAAFASSAAGESEQYLRLLAESRSRLLLRVNRKLIAAREEERKRIARELHDRIGQAFYSVAVALSLANRENAFNEPLRKYMEDLGGTLAQAMSELKAMIAEIRSTTLEQFGLLEAMTSYKAAFEPRWNLKVNLHIQIRARRYPPEIEVAVYRVYQEALLNAGKYSRSDRVVVVLFDSRRQLTMTVQDFGVGFAAADRDPNGGGFGLHGMQERVLLLNGMLRIDSEPGMGTRIRMTIPLPDD